MDSSQSKTGIWLARLLAGLEAGVLAGMIMTAWLMLGNLRRGQTFWTTPNLVSTAILGRAGLRTSFGAASLEGLSLQVVMAGLHGVVFAVLVPPTLRAVWAVNAGILFSLASYGFFFGWALKQLAPLVAMLAPRPTWLGAFFLFGVALGFYPHFVRDLLPRPESPGQDSRPNPNPVSGVERSPTSPS